MIYYFSGTGNSKYAAEKLAVKTGDRAVSMVEALKNGADNIEAGEKTGFVFPVYFWGLPEIVRRFAESVKGRLGGYVYCVITCGADTGGAAGLLAKALGREPDYSAWEAIEYGAAHGELIEVGIGEMGDDRFHSFSVSSFF